MWAKIILIILILLLVIYHLHPNMQRHIDHYGHRVRTWLNENNHGDTMVGFTEIPVSSVSGSGSGGSGSGENQPLILQHNVELYQVWKIMKQNGQLHGSFGKDGIDDLDPDCFWKTGQLLCP